MDAIEAILHRRSIRHFTRQPLSQEQLELLLRAAMHAPSAANTQLWHFVVVEDRELLEKVTEFHPAAECLHEAPLAILVCGDERLEKRSGRWVLDTAAATENLLIAAEALGLGTTWIGIYPDEMRVEETCKIFNIPDQVHPLALVAIGYPDGTRPPVTNRYKADRVHHNVW
jgi:nitroreductase